MSALMPEQQATAPSFYDSREALRYSTCHQTSQLQEELTVAALQLLDLPVSSIHLKLLLCIQACRLMCSAGAYRLPRRFCLTLAVGQA